MLKRCSTAVAIGLVLAGCSPKGKGPLSFQSPVGWKVEWKTDGLRDFYALTTQLPGGGLLMFSQWPPATRREDIPAAVRQLADRFVEQARRLSTFQLASEEYRVEPFAGGHCVGSYATFRIESGAADILQVMFLMSVDGRVWNGQFTGTTKSWAQALTVLQSIRKM